MSVYLGNITIGNGNYLGNQNITDNNIFMPTTTSTTTTTTTAAPTTTTTTVYPPQYWNVRQCGTVSPITQLGIQFISVPLLAGYAVRPLTAPFAATRLPGYENGCWELISAATTGTLCGILGPAVNCAQNACNTTTTTAAP